MTLSCLGLVPRLRWLFVGILRVVEPLPHRQRFSARNYMTTLASASLSWENQEHRTHMVGQFTVVILGCVWLHWHCDAPCSPRPSLGYSHTWLQCTVVSQYGTSLSSHFRTLVSALRIFHCPSLFLVLGEYLIFSGNPFDDVLIHWQVFITRLPVRTSSWFCYLRAAVLGWDDIVTICKVLSA